VTLAEGDTLPNKDFVLRYRVATDEITSAFLLHEEGEDAWFTTVLYPPDDLAALPAAPLELVFVLDCSGSMSGAPMRVAKRAIHRALDGLGPRDTFQVIRFSNKASALGPAPVPATRQNIARAHQYVDRLRGQGGTAMIQGIKAALDFPHDEHRVRLVTFMTDGYIGNDREILAEVHDRLGSSKIFSFGVGSAPNRFLLERMASIGQGAVAYVSLDEGANDAAIDAFLERIRHPALADIDVDWGGMEVYEVYPSRVPDLWTGRPVVVTGRLDGTVGESIEVRGWVGGERHVVEVPIQMEPEPRPALAKVWARMKIMDLADRSLWSREPQNESDAIRDLALRYGLMSRFTAFVAVDSSEVTEGESGGVVPQAVPVPEGVSYEMTVEGPSAED
jgi:Ca-activated chloride channel family protein